MFNHKYYSTNEFKEGFNACIAANGIPANTKNPYPKDSEKFYAWNVGWNNSPALD